MVCWSSLEASCPICGHRIRLREVGSGFAIGQDTDLLVRMRGKHVIQAEIHSCQKCRFSGYESDFLRDISPATTRRFLEEISPALEDRKVGKGAADENPAPRKKRAKGAVLPSRTPLPDVQYYWAYRSAEALSLSPLAQGERLLRAYWCLRLAPSSHLPLPERSARKKLYLRAAIGKLRKGLRFSRERNLVYLVGELCRRNGNFLLSQSYLRRYLEREAGARYLKQAARKLLDLAEERVSRDMTMEEILYDRTPDAKKPRDPDRGPS